MDHEPNGASQAKSCLKFGCCGCLALFLAFLLFLGFAVFMQERAKDLPPDIEERNTDVDLPTPPPLPPGFFDASGDAAETAGESIDELGEEGRIDGESVDGVSIGGDTVAVPRILPMEAAPLPRLQDPQVGRLEIDMALGDFSIRPGPPGEPMRVEAEYDKRNFELREEWVEDETGAWTYRIKYGSRGGLFGMMLRGGGNNPTSRVTVVVPRDQPLDLVGFLGIGDSKVDLGGLWLRNVDLELGTGEHRIDFSEPLVQPMESFRLNKGVGELDVDRLGAASPTEVHIDQQVGELRLDLSGGSWFNDSSIDVDFGLGDCRLRLPDEGVRVNLDKVGVSVGERRLQKREVAEFSEDAPTLTIRAQGSVGEVRIE